MYGFNDITKDVVAVCIATQRFTSSKHNKASQKNIFIDCAHAESCAVKDFKTADTTHNSD